MRVPTIVVVAAAAVCVAGCSSPSVHESVTTPTHAKPLVPITTLAPSNESTPTTTSCASGTVTVRSDSPGTPTAVCAHVGATIVLQGGDGMSAGTWPGPPHISDTSVVSFLSGAPSGQSFTGTFKAIGTGSAAVTVPFVPGPDVCDPTPCTPVPGAPLVLDVTVVP